MTAPRPEIARVIDELLAASAESGEASIDRIAEAIGAMAITSEEIDAVMRALESAGRRVTGPEGPRGEAHLREVLAAARALIAELGRKPTAAEVAARSGLSLEEVRHALTLVRVMQP